MDDCQEEIVALPQILLDAANDRRTVGIADLLRDHTNRVSALVAESTGKEVWPIIELLGGRTDAVLGLLRNGPGRWRIVEDGRHGAWGKS